MKELLIFAGTTEGRKLSECLAEAGIAHTVCVATEYGEIVLKPHSLVTVHQGRMNQEEIEKFLQSWQFAAVIDATHPYATEVTASIKAALDQVNKSGDTSYMRLKREQVPYDESGVTFFQTNEACAKALEAASGNVLLTTGSKDLSTYCTSELKDRLYVRVLPAVESISLCAKHGIHGKQVIAMQGPFTLEMNEAVIRQFDISCLVTKESGRTGGFPEKLEAAKRTGTQVFVIGCPKEAEGDSFTEICAKLEKICGKKIAVQHHRHNMEIVLAGIGMGDENSLTNEAEKAIQEADLLLGAPRLLEQVCSNIMAKKQPYYQAKQIVPFLQDIQNNSLFQGNKKVAVLFSGDSGFYSGCQPLYAALQKEIKEERLKASLRILPGISSVAYLSACIGESYQDAAVVSMHGKKLCNLANKIKYSPKTFLLTSGVQDVNQLGKQLTEAGLTECEVIAGYQLSYEGQKIQKYTPFECCELKEEGLYTCFIKNPHAIKRKLAHGMADGQFIRDKVPMTKEEVREVSICKLRLHEGAVLYDIGSGTGSIAVEAAALSDDVQVYAIEHKKEAVSLLEKNKEKAGLQNITVVEAMAPDGLMVLPAATHAFIGGSGGRLKEILTVLRQINPAMRIVINAISMETICEIKEILSMGERIKGQEVVQLQVSRVKETGSYHLVRSENPVWICAFDFCE